MSFISVSQSQQSHQTLPKLFDLYWTAWWRLAVYSGTALVDSLPVAKTDVQMLAGDSTHGSAMRVCTHTSASM